MNRLLDIVETVGEQKLSTLGAAFSAAGLIAALKRMRIYTENGVRINDAKVIKADVEAANGVIHVIDSVLLPSATAIA